MQSNASNVKNGVLFVAVRIKKRPISNEAVSFIMRAGFAEPVHMHVVAYHELPLSATCKDVYLLANKLKKQHNCKKVEIDITKDAYKKLLKNE